MLQMIIHICTTLITRQKDDVAVVEKLIQNTSHSSNRWKHCECFIVNTVFVCLYELSEDSKLYSVITDSMRC